MREIDSRSSVPTRDGREAPAQRRQRGIGENGLVPWPDSRDAHNALI